jgi:hypothetical protein
MKSARQSVVYTQQDQILSTSELDLEMFVLLLHTDRSRTEETDLNNSASGVSHSKIF